MEIPASGLLVVFSLLAPVPTAFAQPTPSLRIKSFSVGPDQTLSYPSSLANLPDEHTTFMPPASPTGPYLLFGASNISGGPFGAVVLQTTDLKNFDFATAFGYNPQVMTGPVPLGQCNPTYVREFDGNYAAPGSVVQDPTLPAGNFIMIYEAENHCPGGVFNMPFYATTGFARSSDGGKTWPAPINGVLGGPARHPVLQSSDPQPSVAHASEGDAIPSAFVDLDADQNYYLYVSYTNYSIIGTGAGSGLIRVARAKLGADPLDFGKWYDGSFSQAGIGGSDTGVTPSAGCAGGGQVHSEINYNDDLGAYLMIFVCLNGPTGARVGAWYYSTATSLDFQNWTTPQMIQNSQFPVTIPCPGLTTGDQFDGWYPSTVSPGAAAGHTKLTGYFFFLNGCVVGARQFMSRTFTIVTEPNVTELPHVADGNGFDTLVELINTGTTDANYSLQFFNQSGAPVTYQLDPTQSGMTGTIHAGSQAIVRTAGSGSSTNLGWGQLTAPPSVSGMVIYQQQASPTSLQEGSAPFTAPSQHFFVPFDNTGASTTSIGFVNPSPTQAATVNFTVRYASGGTDNIPAFNMIPLQQIANTVIGIWPGTAGQRGMIEVNATTPIGMVAFRFQGSALTLFDTIGPTAAGSTPVTSTIAHSADGNNFKSTFLLTNSGTVAAPYTLSILNATGQPQTFGFDVASPLSGTVPAGSTLTIDTTGLGSVTNLGWAQLSAAPAVGGIEVFRQTNPGKSEQQATIPISQTNSAHFFLPFDNAANTTSIALANPDPATTATINVTFRYVDGTSNAGQLTLGPRNYNANLLAALFSTTAGKAGVAEFISNVPIAVVEVRFNPTQAFTSLRAVSP